MSEPQPNRFHFRYSQIREFEQTARQFENPEEAERLRLLRLREELAPEADLDDSQLELFAQYVDQIRSIGVDLTNERLQQALSGYPENLESAIETLLEFAAHLRAQKKDFENEYHATNYLAKAMREAWKPRSSR